MKRKKKREAEAKYKEKVKARNAELGEYPKDVIKSRIDRSVTYEHQRYARGFTIDIPERYQFKINSDGWVTVTGRGAQVALSISLDGLRKVVGELMEIQVQEETDSKMEKFNKRIKDVSDNK